MNVAYTGRYTFGTDVSFYSMKTRGLRGHSSISKAEYEQNILRLVFTVCTVHACLWFMGVDRLPPGYGRS